MLLEEQKSNFVKEKEQQKKNDKKIFNSNLCTRTTQKNKNLCTNCKKK